MDNVTTVKGTKEPQDHKEKKPTKKQMFDKYVKPEFKSMVKSDKERLHTAKGVESIRGIADVICGEDKKQGVGGQVARALRIIDKSIVPFLNSIELKIDDWTYKKFMDLNENPFKDLLFDVMDLDKYPENAPVNTWDYTCLLLHEIIVEPYLNKIVQFQGQLNQCD